MKRELSSLLGRPMRGIVLLLPLLLLLGGIKLCFHSPFNFGTELKPTADVPEWAVTLDYLLLGLPFVASGLWGLRMVWRRTRQQFSLALGHAALGFFGVIPTVIALFLVSPNPRSTFSYHWETDGGLVMTFSSMIVTLVFASLWAGVNLSFLYLYITGVVDEGSGKYDKRASEPDAVGSLIQEMRRRELG